jgi:hypothetical protein
MFFSSLKKIERSDERSIVSTKGEDRNSMQGPAGMRYDLGQPGAGGNSNAQPASDCGSNRRF